MKQAAVILIFPPGISPDRAKQYLQTVVVTLPPPLAHIGPIEVGCADSFNPDYAPPSSTNPEVP